MLSSEISFGRARIRIAPGEQPGAPLFSANENRAQDEATTAYAEELLPAIPARPPSLASDFGTQRACSPLKTKIPVQRARAQLGLWLPVQLFSASACQLIRRHPPALGREST